MSGTRDASRKIKIIPQQTLRVCRGQTHDEAGARSSPHTHKRTDPETQIQAQTWASWTLRSRAPRHLTAMVCTSLLLSSSCFSTAVQIRLSIVASICAHENQEERRLNAMSSAWCAPPPAADDCRGITTIQHRSTPSWWCPRSLLGERRSRRRGRYSRLFHSIASGGGVMY